MKNTKEKNIPEQDAVLKISICQKCNGIVTASLKHAMDIKSKNKFAKEVMEHNLKVIEQPLLEYRKEMEESRANWCNCD